MSLTYTSFIEDRANKNTLQTGLNSNADYDNIVLKHCPLAYYLINYATQKFEFARNSSILGYTDADLIAGGLSESRQNIHPDDFSVISNEVFPYIWDFVASLSREESEYRYSLNYRYKRKDQSYMHLQQHITFLDFDSHRLPLRNLSFIQDISQWKTDNSIDLAITRLDNAVETIVVRKKYFVETSPRTSSFAG